MNGEDKSIDDFLEALRKSGFNSPEIEAFAKQMISSGPLCDTVPNAHGEFGYEKSNPIPVHNPNGEMAYLRILRCQCGEAFDFSRVGSCGPSPDGHLVDEFELVCKTGTHKITLYMDMYHLGPSSLVPKGLKKTDG